MENHADKKTVKNKYHFLDNNAKTKKYFHINKENKRLGKTVKIWKTIEIKNMKDYNDLCLNVILLLADIFQYLKNILFFISIQLNWVEAQYV